MGPSSESDRRDLLRTALAGLSIRVVIICCHLLNDRSGSPTVLRSTLEVLQTQDECRLYLGSQGYGVLDQVSPPARRYWYRRSGCRIVTLFTYIMSQVSLYRALCNAEDIPGDALVFINTLLPIGGMVWGRRTGRRVVVHVHEISITPGPLRFLLKRLAAHCADTLIYVSHDHRRRLPIEGPRSEVVYNPVNLAFRGAAKAFHYSPRRTGFFEVVMLSSPRKYKGIGEFLTLAQALKERHDIRFTLVLNDVQTEVESFRARHAVPDSVAVHPRTDNPASYYVRADIVLNLARVDKWIETFGLTLLEAMAFGVPVIGPPVGGPAEIIEHGRNGFCIDSRDCDALKGAVLELADDPDRALAMSQRALSRANDFDFEVYSEHIRRIVFD